MMAKITAAMGRTGETAPIVTEPPLPKAPIYVVLGSRALKKFFPGKAGAPGEWRKTDDGRDFLVTYSPDFFLRFSVVTPQVKELKAKMWTSLKGVLQRLALMERGRG